MHHLVLVVHALAASHHYCTTVIQIEYPIITTHTTPGGEEEGEEKEGGRGRHLIVYLWMSMTVMTDLIVDT